VANRWRLILASKKVGEKGRKLHHLGVFIDRGEREGERMQARLSAPVPRRLDGPAGPRCESTSPVLSR
jgi:hypothetical protein